MKDQLKHYEDKLAYEIDPWDLKAAIENGENVIVVDARRNEAYETEHIAPSVNLPHMTINEETTAGLDKSALYVAYCDGIGCNASTKGALNLTKLGFRVKELMGGIWWWKNYGYKTEGTKAASSCGC